MPATVTTLRYHLRQNRRTYALGGLALILVNMCDVALPFLLKLAIDDLVVLGGFLPLAAIAALYAFLVLVLGVHRYFWRQYFFGAAHRIGNSLRSQLCAHLERLSESYFDRQRTGDLMSRATGDLEAVRFFCSIGLLLILDTTMYLCLMPPAMIALSGELTLYALIPLVPVPLLVYGIGKQVHKRFRVVQDTLGELSAAVEEGAGGIRVVKSFAQEPHVLERFGQVNDRYRNQNMRLQLIHGVAQPLMNMLMGIAVFITIVVGGRMAIDGTISVGDFVAFHAYLVKLGWPLRAVGMTVNLYQRGRAAMGRLQEVFAATPEIIDAEGSADGDAPSSGAVSVRNLNFTYPGADKPSLTSVSFEVPAGKTVALVGLVGAGKSTVLELMMRLYDPPPNTVFVDGRCVREWAVESMRSVMGYVPQESFLFADTIANNVALGADGVTPAELRAACERARVVEHIDALPGGMDAVIGERGVDLSGGQRQRLAIARALVRKPKLLLLDDCLSAVDAETEAAILEGLFGDGVDESARPSVVIASHRLAAVRHADHVVVFEYGRVVEEGTHRSLVDRDGVYAGMWRRQRLEQSLGGQTP